ncbi:MAG: 1,4-dihydroxy-2-naphthoate octaprenyltransferase [Bacteroidota bacterium]|nr:1,4-dihydroxy-2-naphthoate octaprenyltransferase [Bacteroidota bacterium]MEE3147937.1 1,4-dihydroxy-2-naphthoate octaprenyltransferase [Bacteroidota bacterium]MEE3244582.1 1,4-dihydroxy-2-naphthoate octaprenyltransferase [Bacteroidota bacterium]
MTPVKAWVSAARLRTLPLSVSGIIVGSAMAYNSGFFRWDICILALLATLGFQILSNFANDYGDGVKGTDNHERIGPARAMQSGLLTAKQLKNGMVFTASVTLLISIALIYTAFGSERFLESVLFFVLGLLAILAAVKYTVGKSAYGYMGLGDLFVFIFFGLVAVAGSYYLYAAQLDAVVFLPALTVGFLSIAVLNLNNMRDRLSDARAKKNTLAVFLGPKKSKFYHYFLIVGALVASLLFFHFTNTYLWSVVACVVFIPLGKHLAYVAQNESPALLDPELKKVALATFFFSVLFTLGFLF